jgi:hypothetical protein
MFAGVAERTRGGLQIADGCDVDVVGADQQDVRAFAGVIEPVAASRPRERAPLMVAISMTCRNTTAGRLALSVPRYGMPRFQATFIDSNTLIGAREVADRGLGSHHRLPARLVEGQRVAGQEVRSQKAHPFEVGRSHRPRCRSW